jgi:hypothetical protein
VQLPSILQGESLTRLLQGAAVGAVATMIVGFYWGGWMLGSTAKKLATDETRSAIVTIAAPACAEHFVNKANYSTSSAIADACVKALNKLLDTRAK